MAVFFLLHVVKIHTHASHVCGKGNNITNNILKAVLGPACQNVRLYVHQSIYRQIRIQCGSFSSNTSCCYPPPPRQSFACIWQILWPVNQTMFPTANLPRSNLNRMGYALTKTLYSLVCLVHPSNSSGSYSSFLKAPFSHLFISVYFHSIPFKHLVLLSFPFQHREKLLWEGELVTSTVSNQSVPWTARFWCKHRGASTVSLCCHSKYVCL